MTSRRGATRVKRETVTAAAPRVEKTKPEPLIKPISLKSFLSLQPLQQLLLSHKTGALISLQRLLLTPTATLTTVCVIAIALALPAFLYILTENIKTLAAQSGLSPQISIFMQQQVSDKETLTVSERLQGKPGINEIKFVSRTEAYAEFQTLAGVGDSLQDLDENPLPALIVVKLAPGLTLNALEELQKELSALPGVDNLQLDSNWLKRLHAIIGIINKVVTLLGAFLGIGVVLIISNTIRLMVENRRNEILVTKLVGATDSFVRRPFLYTGFWLGLSGGCIALFLSLGGMAWLNQSVQQLAQLYSSPFRLKTMEILTALELIIMGAFLGWFGAWLAVNRQLAKIEPQ